MSQSTTNHFDTIIIGAGISGLACASKLLQHNNQAQHQNSPKKICILEARDRVGGRINSVYTHGCRLDTGANWVHGVGSKENSNPLMTILPHKRYRALSGTVAFRPPQIPTSPAQSSVVSDKGDWQHVSAAKKQTLLQPSGDLVVPSESAATLMGAVWESIESLHEMAHSVSPVEANRTSMLSALTKSNTFSDVFKELPEEYHSALSGMPQFLEPMEGAPLVAQSAEHSDESPGFSLSEYAINDFDGEQVFLQDGYIAIINELAKPLLDAKMIHTNVEVNEIDWSTTPISLRTSSGVYTADHVVCTLPLGVLKKKSSDKTFFKPALPPEKTRAISSLGFGTLDKIFLVYDTPWWTSEPYASILQKGFSRRRPFSTEANSQPPSSEPDSLAGFTHELPGFAISADGTVSHGPRMLSIINLHSLCGFPALSAFISCANAAHMETLSDAEASAIVHRSLDSWFGRHTPALEAVHVTRWASDPYSLGSYSHMITGVSRLEDRAEFQKSLSIGGGKGSLRFAGEHTSRNHFATAHGALLSGWREVEALIAGWNGSWRA